MNIRSIRNGVIVNNIALLPMKNVPSSNENESTVESYFEEHLKNIGYGLPGGFYTKRVAKKSEDRFPSKSGSGDGEPDYIFYDAVNSGKIIAIGEAKCPDPHGCDRSVDGIDDCKNIYLKGYNAKHADNPIRVCFGYDGVNFCIQWLSDEGIWEDVTVDGVKVVKMPSKEFLLSLAINGGSYSTQLQKNISREQLEPYFARCDSVFRNGKTSLSAVDKAAEISILIFLYIFSRQGRDKSFENEYGQSVWGYIEKGNVSAVNNLFKEFLNKYYENVFPNELIKVDSQMLRDLANIINKMFSECDIDSMTDIKGNALEYYQKESKDKKIGEFFTPRHLIELMTFLTNPQIEFEKDDCGEYVLDKYGNHVIKKIETVYDPACGSGGFLIMAFQNYLENYRIFGVTNDDLKHNVIFGNELKDRTVMLTKLNMILLGDGHNHISNENALGYEKKYKIKRVKDLKGNYIEIPSEKVIWEKNAIDGSNILVEKDTKKPVFEQILNPRYYLGNRNKQGKLVRVKDLNGKYIIVNEKEVGNKLGVDGELTYFRKNDNAEVIKTGYSKHKYFKGEYSFKSDGITPEIEYKNVCPVNAKVRNYHDNYFGKFDIVMANHPYALEEPQQPDELFVKHMVESVRKGGRIACIVSETLLFHKDYKRFREWALENVVVEGIISLPQGVFNPYTDVKTSILLIKKDKPKDEHKTWLVDLKNDGFDLNLTRSPIKENDIPKVKNLWKCWGEYLVLDSDGKQIYKSYHEEEMGFAEFHRLDAKNWCVKRYNTPAISMGTEYELVSIGKLLTRCRQNIILEDDVAYKRVTIRVKNKGIEIRDEKYGADIGTKSQFVIKKGQFLISKIDARNGAYDIVPEALDGAIITGNFWTFNINTDIVLPKYLTYLMRHEFFQNMCETCSYGSTNRWYLDEDTFINFKIPLPLISEQKKILDRIEAHEKIISKLKKDIFEEENKIMMIIDDIIASKLNG